MEDMSIYVSTDSVSINNEFDVEAGTTGDKGQVQFVMIGHVLC